MASRLLFLSAALLILAAAVPPAHAGNVTFEPRVDYATGGPSWSVAIGDLNADGKADLVTADSYSGQVSVLLNLGGGVFAPRAGCSPGGLPWSIAIGDLNGDGKPDLAAALYAGSDNVAIFFGVGDGTFPTTPSAYIATGNLPTSVATADLNRDGKLDLVTTNLESSKT